MPIKCSVKITDFTVEINKNLKKSLIPRIDQASFHLTKECVGENGSLHTPNLVVWLVRQAAALSL